MHNEILRRVFALLLICALALSATACGSPAVPANDADSPSDATEQTDTEAGGVKYASSFTPVKDVSFDALSSVSYTEDGFYAAASYYDGGMKILPVFIGYDGTVKELTAYTPIASAENANGRANYSASDSIVSVSVLSDGRLLVILNTFETWNDDPEITPDDIRFYETSQTSQKTYARFLNADGEESASFLFNISEQESVMHAAAAADDTILIVTTSGLYAYSPDGRQLWKAKTEEAPQRVLFMPDGRVCFTAYTADGLALFPLDGETHEPSEAISLPAGSDSLFTGDGKHDFYYSSGSNFFSFDLAADEPAKEFSWIDLNVTDSMYFPVYVAKDGSVHGYINESTYGDGAVKDYQVFRIDEVPVSSVGEKKAIVLATLGLSYDSQKQVIKFNRSSEDYQITVADYSQYAVENDFSAAVMKLQTDILTGSCPDIIDLSNMAVDRLAARGLLEDLYPYIDADAELKREDYLPNILAAAENDGKLVSTVSGFGITSLAGASDVVGSQPGWTYDEFNAALTAMPEGCIAVDPSSSRKDILDNCLTLDLNHYVDWAAGTCDFECEEFTDLLEFAKTFPAVPDMTIADEMSTRERIAGGMQMLLPCNLTTVTSVFAEKPVFGERPYTYIGYPTYTGESGNFIVMSAGFGMSAGCREKQGAWEFLRTFFTESYQRSSYNIPSNKAAFNAKLKNAMTVQYEKDENGSWLLDENGEKIPQMVFQYVDGENIVKYYALSQEDADMFVSLVENTARCLEYDVSILNIVEQQAEAFFEGQKSAEEVARLIQSKAAIYISEQH